MAHIFINDVKAGMQLNEVYMVTQPILRHTTRGDLYIAMFLSDKTGKVNARMWQATEAIYNKLPSEGFVNIRGKSELYQGALQIIINDLVVVEPSDVNLADYMPKTEKDVKQMYTEMKKILSAIKNPELKRLVDSFLADADLMNRYATAPAAMQMHHAYLGGLLEHTLNMLNVAVSILPYYPKIQADLVLAAIFLHDIGKIRELSYDIGFSYTNSGQLLGHIILGTDMIMEKADILASQDKALSTEILDSLLHIIASHHGCYEFGSPKLPATAEAFMVNYIDDLDAKMNQVTGLIDNDPGDTDWTAYHKSLETRLFRKRPLMDY